MASPKVTLKDIAQALDVTTTTVHRALQGKEGVSEDVRREVQRVAAEMGYRSNYMAAALKRGGLKIAIALPQPTGEDRFYYANIWQGLRRYLEEVSEFNIEVVEYGYHLSYGANGAVLQQIYENHANKLDGLLTVAVDQPQSSYFIEKLADKGVPVVFVGSDLYKDKRFCCVKTYDTMAGSLAAELLCAFGPAPAKVLLTGHFGQLGMGDQHDNARGFEQYLQQHAPAAEVLPVYGEDAELVSERMAQLLQQDGGIGAVYSCSARYTIRMAAVVQGLGLQGRLRLIGNDCFAESVELLQNGTLTAIIDKKIPRQSYLAAKALVEYVLKKEYPASSVLYVRPEVVLQSNVGHELYTL